MTSPALPLRVRLFSPMLRRIRPAWLAVRFKRIIGIPRVVVHTENGVFEVDPVSLFGHLLIHDRIYEPAIVRGLHRFLRTGNTFVDLGANEGYFAIIAARIVGPQSRVIAIEPQSRLRAPIERNIQLNELRNVDLIPTAISDQEGATTLYLTPDVNTGSSGLKAATRYRVDQETVRVTTLAQLFVEKSIDRIDFLKMDIESFEYEAILGSAELFRSGNVKVLQIDWHEEFMRRRGLDPDRLKSALGDFGYRTEVVDGLRIWIHHSHND